MRKIVLGLLIFVCFLLSGAYVFNNDIRYDADIARDFLILEEIHDKKFILIGPRSGAAPGFFHGPLWSYLNYPAFSLGKGNPVAVGYFWVFLNGLFLLSCYWITKKLFNQTSALLLTLFIAIRMIEFTSGFFNPSGAMLLIPIFIYLLIHYQKTLKLRYLLAHVLIGGLIIQFQIAVGAPFMILSFLAIVLNCLKKRTPLSHLFAFSIISLTFLTYVLFDIRHDHELIKAVISYFLSPKASLSTHDLISDRIRIMFGSGLFFFRGPLTSLNLIVFLVMAWTALRVILKRLPYPFWILWYFYFGFFVLSLINRGTLGIYYYFPLLFLPILIFISLKPFINQKFFTAFLTILIVLNFFSEMSSLKSSISSIGKHQISWQFHNYIAADIFTHAGNKFGLFLYAPDVLGYRSKYPLIYQQRLHPQKKMILYQKEPETFILLAGMPEYHLPWSADPLGFKRDSLRIDGQPKEKWPYGDNYSVEKYLLTDSQINVPFDQNINNWLHFR